MARSYYKDEEPVPGFRLVQFLGRGGFGEVWKATAPGGTEAAVKIINLSGRQGLKEFRAIRLVKKIRHPNLVPLYAFWLKDEQGNLLEESLVQQDELSAALPRAGTEAHRPAELIIAMGLGEKNLLDRMEECHKLGLPGIPLDELLNHMEDAAKALDFLNSPRHDMGSGPVAIQHCDIKPQNIIIVGGAAQVCDFGLARVLGGDVRTSLAAVSPAYGAPECLRSNQPSQSTDQYSLAISFVELRTGELPFDGDSYPAVINAHLNGTLNLSRLVEAERTVIQRATALDPKDRFPSSMEMVRALRRSESTSSARGAMATGGVLIQKGVEIVPGYKLLHLLGRGGFGEVWEAAAPGGKHVALKIIRNLGGTKGRREFNALELIKGVDHNHLMELHAYWILDETGSVIPDELRDRSDGPAPGTLVIAGKLANKNLLQRLEECRAQTGSGIPPRELLRYMRQTAEALDYLNTPQHVLGNAVVSIQHRDIKPENILLAADIVKVGDFGLAKVVEGTASAIRADSRGLTLAYAAPEILQGEVTRWTDQYSLAITYFQLRTGDLPFEATISPFELMELHRNGMLDFHALSTAEQAVIKRATAVTPKDRFPSCMEMVIALESACGLVPTEPLPQNRIVPPSPTPPPAPAGQTVQAVPKWPTAPVAPHREGQGTLVAVTPALQRELTPVRETTPRDLVGTTSSQIAIPSEKKEPAPADEPISRLELRPRTRGSPLGFIMSSLAVAALGGYLVWSLLPTHGTSGTSTSKSGSETESSKTGESNAEELAGQVMALVEAGRFSEAIDGVDAGPDPAAVVELKATIRDQWISRIEEAVQSGDYRKAAEQIKTFLTRLPADSRGPEVKGLANQAASALLSAAQSSLEQAPEEALAQCDLALNLAGSGVSEAVRKGAVLGRMRALARHATPSLEEIRQTIRRHLPDRGDLGDSELAQCLAVEAIAICPKPGAADRSSLDTAIAKLFEWDRPTKFLDALDSWERAGCIAIVKAAVEQAKQLPDSQAPELSRELVSRQLMNATPMAARIRDQIPLLGSRDDFAAMLKELQQLGRDGTADGWVLACQSECLVEQSNGKPPRADLEQARSAAQNPLVVTETGSYGHYVRAIVHQAERQTEQAARELVQVFEGDWKFLADQGLRRSRAYSILQTAASQLRSPLPPLDLGKSNPFQSADRADQVFQWTTAAQKIADAAQDPLSVDLRVLVALAAWYGSDPDRSLVRQTTGALIRETESANWGDAAQLILLLQAQSQENDVSGRAAAIDAYARLLELLGQDKKAMDALPLNVYVRLLSPAMSVSKEVSDRDAPDAMLQAKMASFYATAGSLLGQHRYLTWPLAPGEDSHQKAVELYDEAVRLDRENAKYHIGRAYARSRPYARTRVPPAILEQLREDAERAIQLDRVHPGGHGLIGYVLLLQSRGEPNAALREQSLLNAAKAYEQAIANSKADDEDLPTLLTSSSSAHTELANSTIDPTKQKQREYLVLAKDQAERATQLGPRYPEFAWEALGNALEDIAWIVGETQNYEASVQAFTRAIEAREDLPKSWLSRGRCQYKRSAFGGHDAQYLDRAVEDIQEAIKRDERYAEAYYWLAKVYVAQSQYTRADEAASRAVQLSEEAQDENWASYAVDWALIPLYDANNRGRNNPKDPEIPKRITAVRERAKKLAAQSPAKAAYILGQSYFLEGKASEAHEAYTAGLHADPPSEIRLELLAARSNLIYQTPALWKSDLSQANPQAIQDADAVAASSLPGNSLRASALVWAAQVRLKAAADPAKADQRDKYRLRAIEQLREALELAPKQPGSWFWRALLARQLKIYVDDKNTRPEDREAFRTEALRLLDEAMETAPDKKDKDQIEDLRRSIRERR